jgi:hypothetical protein
MPLPNTEPPPILDHIVILVSHTTLKELPERFKDSLQVSTGGDHADGLTSNHIIILRDGVYLEVIAFKDGIDPERRKSHQWGQMEENTIIDWAYTQVTARDFAQVQERVGAARSGYLYENLVDGGRVQPDGTRVEWSTSAAYTVDGGPVPRGTLPFWCIDKTDRQNRVPSTDSPKAKHPSDAQGISSVLVRIPTGQSLRGVSTAYDAIHRGDSPSPQTWIYETPNSDITGAKTVTAEAAPELAPGGRPQITFKLLPGPRSPSSVEILPRFVLEFDK